MRARTTTEHPRRFLFDCLSRTIPSVSTLIPLYNSLLRNVQIIRQRINLPLTIPSDAAHLIIPEQYKISFRNEIFLLYEGLEKDEERFILFATPRQFNILGGSSQIYFDSIFNSLDFLPVIYYSRRIQQCINSMCICVNGTKN
ncbi:LOW QUALITY PROTEIN: hypothetical protein HZS_4822 [Henneguya salminicola]|nr:LOW QUALITY PROTEIN: hypothetical protein HZS_4822 [Henneguya salminicola]